MPSFLTLMDWHISVNKFIPFSYLLIFMWLISVESLFYSNVSWQALEISALIEELNSSPSYWATFLALKDIACMLV